ncbi:hypothetical protein F7725_026001 [Dissostichus mawsoni]|uniref:Uncharacterized protein n=1 Tax=Dissostichus mawsoni TaxID=36200 RepID=A0A7J5X5V2_DISMA|nr:hypothetical protein F7725_026001 [Dissostichus mawsoni]
MDGGNVHAIRYLKHRGPMGCRHDPTTLRSQTKQVHPSDGTVWNKAGACAMDTVFKRLPQSGADTAVLDGIEERSSRGTVIFVIHDLSASQPYRQFGLMTHQRICLGPCSSQWTGLREEGDIQGCGLFSWTGVNQWA